MKKCRMCKGEKFKQVIDFGNNAVVNSLVERENLDKTESTYPLVVIQCQSCFLVQTETPISSHQIYTDQDYLYYSSDMPYLREYFLEYANDIRERFKSKFVVEMGSNDGLLLNIFKGMDSFVLGVDPATNVVIRALKRDIPTLSAPFNARYAKVIRKEFAKADIIAANNCIAHIDDLDDVMAGVEELLADEGVFVIECNYWGGMVVNKNYSLIYHDHFSYFTVGTWVNYLKKFNLEAFDAFVTPAQGGSLRLFMGRPGVYEETERFKELMIAEVKDSLNSYETAKYYKKTVTEEAQKLHNLIVWLKKKGKKIAGYGAAAKGFSVLKLAEIDENHIDYFVDDSPAKQGKYTPVSHIPVISRDQAEDQLPDYFFITAPNYKDVIIEKEVKFQKNGGKFVTVESKII